MSIDGSCDIAVLSLLLLASSGRVDYVDYIDYGPAISLDAPSVAPYLKREENFPKQFPY
jgi:hypothetical protein